MKKNKLIAHLTDDQISTLIKRYYNGELIKNLVQEYKIDLQNNYLYQLFPPIVTAKKCAYCDNVKLVKKYIPRPDQLEEIPRCPLCNHTDNKACNCNICSMLREFEIEQKQQKEQLALNSILKIDEAKRVELDSVNFKDRVYLGALLRTGISEDFNFIKPVDKFTLPLTPTYAYTSKIITHLFNKRLIVIDPDSDPKAFPIIDIKTRSCSFHKTKVSWILNVKKAGFNKVLLVDALINPHNLSDPEQSYHLWREIALYEGLAYINHNIRKTFNLENEVAEKTITVLNDLLNIYPLSQVFAIIYNAMKSAALLQKDKHLSNQKAANSIITFAQSYAERAKINKWVISNFSRIKELPESMLSKFFFERILKIGNAGFTEVPRVIQNSPK